MLLNEVGAIVEAPNSTGEQAYMVVRPHYVSISKNGKVTCGDCPGWNAFKIPFPGRSRKDGKNSRLRKIAA